MNARWSRVALAGPVLFAATAGAADWAQWRGPKRNGVSQETGLLKEWPAEGPKLLWQVGGLGNGYSTPSIFGERIFFLSNSDMDNELVVALDARDGRQVWSARVGKVGLNQGLQYPGARSTPTVDGDLLFALGSAGDLACLETATGKMLWKKNLHDDFAGRPGNWAYSESPLVDGDVVICTPGGKNASLVALEKKTGELVWKSLVPNAGEAAYASAIVVEAGGVRQYVQLMEKAVVGVDAKTGRFLWRYNSTAKSMANIPTPLARDDYVYTASRLGGGGLVKLRAIDGSFEPEQVYLTPKVPKGMGGSVQVGDYLYGTGDRGLMCVGFTTGKIIWEDKCVGPGSIAYADGLLYVHGENTGTVAVVEATPKGYHEVGRVTPPGHPDYTKDGSGVKAWEYPVIANGRLYLRNIGSLWCYDIKASH
jgi:outer membrane protein assembly factor BamB